MKASFGVTVNYRYLPSELEENHERFVRGEIQVANGLIAEQKSVAHAWHGSRKSNRTPEMAETVTSHM
jgi:hypothetical protein